MQFHLSRVIIRGVGPDKRSCSSLTAISRRHRVKQKPRPTPGPDSLVYTERQVSRSCRKMCLALDELPSQKHTSTVPGVAKPHVYNMPGSSRAMCFRKAILSSSISARIVKKLLPPARKTCRLPSCLPGSRIHAKKAKGIAIL